MKKMTTALPFIISPSFWTFSDVFEENGPATRPLNGGFGLVGVWGIKKPSFYAFSLLHKLGETRIANASHNLIVTRRSDVSLAIAVWNLYPPDHLGASRTFDLELRGLPGTRRATISRVDEEHGSARAAYVGLGQPQYPTASEVEAINRQTALPAPQPLPITNGHLSLNVPPNGFALLEISK